MDSLRNKVSYFKTNWKFWFYNTLSEPRMFSSNQFNSCVSLGLYLWDLCIMTIPLIGNEDLISSPYFTG